MKRIKRTNKNGRRFRQHDRHGDAPVFERLEPRVLLNAVPPYTQDFSLGKPGIADGWEYYSDAEGRIEVVSGRLRMDDISGNTTYGANEAILHVDLTGKTGVTLTLDHVSLSDENHALPASFVGQFKGDGIVLSVDGQHWVKVTDLTTSFTNGSFSLDTIVQQAMAAAGSTNVSDVRIKFQQYDNFPATSDGREFDNIRITVVVTAPEIELVGNGQVITDGDTVPGLADGTDFGSVLTGGSVTRTFTIRNPGTGTLNLTGTPRVQLTGSADFTVIAQPAATVAANGGTTTFQVRFTAGSAGLKMALVQIASNDGDENPYDFTIQGTGTSQIAQAVPYTQDFNAGKPGIGQGWEYYSDAEGRIEVVSGRLRMDDISGNTTYGANEAILHVDLTGKTGVTLTLDHVSLSDENHALPASFVGQFKGDGIVLSVDGQHWVKVTDLTTSFTNGSFSLDTIVQQAMAAAGSTNVSDVRIKFQQYDNFPATSDGREFDNIRIT